MDGPYHGVCSVPRPQVWSHFAESTLSSMLYNNNADPGMQTREQYALCWNCNSERKKQIKISLSKGLAAKLNNRKKSFPLPQKWAKKQQLNWMKINLPRANWPCCSSSLTILQITRRLILFANQTLVSFRKCQIIGQAKFWCIKIEGNGFLEIKDLQLWTQQTIQLWCLGQNPKTILEEQSLPKWMKGMISVDTTLDGGRKENSKIINGQVMPLKS